MKKILRIFDIFSKEFHLTYKQQNKLQTEFGGLLTLIAFIIILFNGFLIGKDIVYRENPTVLKFEKNYDNSPSTRINYNKIFFGLRISNGEENILNESIINVIPYYEMHFFNKNNQLKHKKIKLNLTDCETEFKNRNIIPQFDISSMICIESLDFILAGSWNEKAISNLNFKIKTCKNESNEIDNFDSFEDDEKLEFLKILDNSSSNNLFQLKSFSNKSNEDRKLTESYIFSKKNKNNMIEKRNICKPKNEIEEELKKMYFNFFFNKISLNSKNFLDPVNSKSDNYWVRLGNSLYKELIFKFNHYVLSTDKRLIFNEPSIEEINIGYQQSTIDYNSKSLEDDLLMEAHIYISNNVQYYNRSYIKIENIFANMGGVMKLVFFIFQILYQPFFNRRLNLKFLNRIYEFDENYQNDYKKRKNIPHSEDDTVIKNLCNMNDHKEYQENSIIYKNDSNETRRNNLNFFRNNSKFLKKINKFPQLVQLKNRNQNIKFSKMNSNFQNSGLCELDNSNEVNVRNIMIKNKKEKKLIYKNIEIMQQLYCNCIFRNKLLERKNKLFDWAKENLYEYTDFFNLVRIQTDIIKLKYFIFNKIQMKSFDFINNPKKYKNEIFHHNEEFAEIFLMGKNKIENATEIVKYFKDRIRLKNLNEMDKKFIDVIDPEIKNVIIL